MAYCRILQWPHSFLRQISSPIIEFDSTLDDLITDLYDTLNVARGAGIAASQIGIAKRVCMLKCSDFGIINSDPYEKNSDILILINPVLEVSGDDVLWSEACLSLGGVSAVVRRKSSVKLQYYTRKGEKRELVASWPFSGALQHECDHLDGILFIDRIGKRAAVNLKKQLRRKLKAEYAPLLKNPKIKKEKKLIDTRLTHGPGKRKKCKRKNGKRKKT